MADKAELLGRLIARQQRRLRDLEAQREVYGSRTPEDIVAQIEDLKKEINDLREELKELTGGEVQIEVEGEAWAGDIVGGDRVVGDKISVGDVSGVGVAIGRGAQAQVSIGDDPGQLVANLFARIYELVDTRPDDDTWSKDDIAEEVRRVEREVTRRDEPNPAKMAMRLKNLREMAPDILEATFEALASLPTSGSGETVRKLVQKTKEDWGIS